MAKKKKLPEKTTSSRIGPVPVSTIEKDLDAIESLVAKIRATVAAVKTSGVDPIEMDGRTKMAYARKELGKFALNYAAALDKAVTEFDDTF